MQIQREQAKELLAVPDRSTVKDKRDYCVFALSSRLRFAAERAAVLKIEDIPAPRLGIGQKWKTKIYSTRTLDDLSDEIAALT